MCLPCKQTLKRLGSETHPQVIPTSKPPFVEYNIPSGVEKRHYREDFVGLRFNQTWMDLLYRDPAPGDDSPYTGPDQKFVFRIIDENNAPVAHLNGNGQTITTLWDAQPLGRKVSFLHG